MSQPLPRLEDLSFEQLVDMAAQEDLDRIKKGHPTRNRIWRAMELALRWHVLKEIAKEKAT